MTTIIMNITINRIKLALRFIGILFSIYAFPAMAHGDHKPLRVITSVLPIKFLAEQIGGDQVVVTSLIGKGQNHHTFEPKPQDLERATSAQAFFRIGLAFEDTWITRLKKLNPNLGIFDLRSGLNIPKVEGHKHHDHDHGEEVDPHLWTDPLLARDMAQSIYSVYSKALPHHANDFKARYEKLKTQLDAMDQDFQKKLTPLIKRHFMVFHPAWGYFAARYNLHQLSIEKDGKEPGPKDMAETIQLAKKIGLKDVFVQAQTSQRSASMIAKELGGKVIEVDPLPEDYFVEMRRFADALEKSLK